MCDLLPSRGIAALFGLDEARPELGFVRRKRKGKTAVEKMFNAAHAGVACFRGADFEGQMACKRNVFLFGLIGDGKKRIPRRHRNDLDEIGASRFELFDGGAGLLGAVDWVLLWSFFATRCKKRTGGNDVRCEDRSGFGFALPGEQSVEIAPHVPHAGDSIGEKKREENLFTPARICGDASKMDMHVPEAS